MRAFAELCRALDEAAEPGARIAALARYLEGAPPADAAWAVHLLAGRRPPRAAPTRRLRRWAAEAAGVPDWLFDECHRAAGDLAETMTLLAPAAEDGSDRPLHEWIEQRLLPLRGEKEAAQRRRLLAAWSELDEAQLLVWNKLATGTFRPGVTRRQLARALAAASGLDPATLAHRLSARREPSAAAYLELVAADTADADAFRPYPFRAERLLEGAPETLGEARDWHAEPAWDGLRAQLVRRRGRTCLWSREGELLTPALPEIEDAGAILDDGTVLEGEVLAWSGGALPRAALERRLGDRKPAPRLRREVPVALIAGDLLERGGEDVRGRGLAWRRRALAEILAPLPPAVAERLRLAPAVAGESWAELDRARRQAQLQGAAGLRLRRLAPAGEEGAERVDAWTWRADPRVLAAVLMYAQRGQGKRAALYSDFTFGLWDGGELVPFARTADGLDDVEVRRLDRFVRRHASERFGPVRALAPELVFDLAFDAVEPAPRRKSGLAARAPRVVRRRHDLRPEQAASLQAARALLP